MTGPKPAGPTGPPDTRPPSKPAGPPSPTRIHGTNYRRMIRRARIRNGPVYMAAAIGAQAALVLLVFAFAIGS